MRDARPHFCRAKSAAGRCALLSSLTCVVDKFDRIEDAATPTRLAGTIKQL
jgi:hypothetical protein